MNPDRNAFDRCLGQTFRIGLGDDALDAELIEVSAIRCDTTDAGRPEPFSLVFRVPGEGLFEQATYPVFHPDLGGHPIFLVPIGPDDHGMRYEAVFT